MKMLSYQLLNERSGYYHKIITLFIDVESKRINSIICLTNNKFRMISSGDKDYMWSSLQELLLFSNYELNDELTDILCEEEFEKLKNLTKEENLVLKK